MQLPASLRSLPNQLTVARILAIPVICLMIVIGWDWLRWLALLIYVAAAVTDWLDGFLARRMNESSDLGKMLDPIADKLLVGALLVTFAWTRDFSGWELIPAIAILMREIFRTITALQTFDIPYMMTSGGPGTSTVTLAMYIHQNTVSFLDLGYGSALAVVMFAFSMAVTFVYLRMLPRKG